MASLSFFNKDYGPTRLQIQQGGNLYFYYDIGFSGTVPAQVTYTIKLFDRNNVVVKTVTGTLSTNGRNPVPVRVFTPPTRDGGGNLGFEGYGVRFEASASGYPDLSEDFCTGITVEPDCDPCADPACEFAGDGAGGGDGYRGGPLSDLEPSCNRFFYPPSRILWPTAKNPYLWGLSSAFGGMCGTSPAGRL